MFVRTSAAPSVVSEEPSREEPLAGSGPGRAHPLEKRPTAEQVEVGGIRVRRFEEPRPVPPSANPAILNAGQAQLVHGSDSADNAATEIALWFKPAELVDFRPTDADWVG